jgi:CRISPR-associated protein Csx10
VQKREEAHIRMNRQTGRVNTGDLYEYIALEAGQWFVGELDCANDVCWQRLAEWTELATHAACAVRVGKASRRGYGAMAFVLQPLAEHDPSPWIGITMTQRVTSFESLSLTLLTDAIIPDAWGRFYAGFDAAWIAETLGLKQGHVELLGNFAAARNVDTFNTYRRNARWRDIAISAGSAAGFRITDEGLKSLEGSSGRTRLEALRDRLAQVEAEGIGLRRHEGFGRVAFNHPLFRPEQFQFSAIDLSQLPDDFASVAENPLASEALFRQTWAVTLDAANWKPITDSSRPEAFEPVARLLFLSRTTTPEATKQRLAEIGEPKPEYLWGKSTVARQKEPKIDSVGLKLVSGLVDSLEQVSGDSRRKWEIGLDLLAERVAIAAAQESKAEGGRR